MLAQERYRLLKQVGQGGFCQTFLAIDEGQSPPVSCIVQQLQLQNQTPEAFEHKAQRLQLLGKNPGIPRVLEYFQQGDQFYLVQELIEGRNLATLLAEMGAFQESHIWQLLESVLPILQLIHEQDIIHCDIKPNNIIIRDSSSLTINSFVKSGLGKRHLVLVDFGSAKLVTANLLTTEPFFCNPEYAAPEQVKGNPVFASDLYSLGLTCIHLLTQIPPFDLFDIANHCWVWRQYLTTNVSERLGKILDQLLQHDISLRFQSADEVMQAMGIYSSFPTPNSPLPTQFWQCTHTLTDNSRVLSSVNSIAMSCEGHLLASGHDDTTVRLWDLKTKKLIHSFAGHSKAVKSVAFNAKEKILATASDDQTIKLWDINTLEEIRTLIGHSHAVKAVAFSPDGQILASGSWDKTVKLWDVKSGREICTLGKHQLQVSAVAFSPQGEMLASGSFDRTIRLWKVGQALEWKGEVKNRPHSTLSGHGWAVLTLAFSPNGKILATGSDDNTIKLWDVDTGQVISTLLGHSWPVMSVAFSTDGETMLSGSMDKTVKLWGVSTHKEIAILSGHVDSVSTVAISPVAQLIASGSRDKTIKLWELVQ